MSDHPSEQEFALKAARSLASRGVPIFVAYPDPASSTGFRLPAKWQTTTPNARYIDAWRPGMALCAVMGWALDLIDIDPRNGFDPASIRDITPHIYAIAETPSGGWHGYVKSLGVRSRDGVLPGVDIKAGVGGEGHGFVFLPPTVRESKVSGQPVAYRWKQLPDFSLDDPEDPSWGLLARNDDSGEKLAELVRAAHGSRNGHEDPDHFKASPWDDLDATIANNTRHDAVHKLASSLRGRGGWRAGDALAYMRATVWPLLDQARGGHPYTPAELEADVRDAFTRYDDGPSEEHQTPTATIITADDPVTLDQCHAVFRRWFGDEYDLDVLDVVLAALAAERLGGDPLWLLVISGPGAAKTETVQACAGAGAIVESTITGEAALLSGTPKKERAKDATGGLLRRIGDRGVLVIKDVTSVISMSGDRRAEVLAALREVHDGYWSRSIGAEGGRTLTWTGRIAVIGATTTAWDTAHAVVSTMGDRFVNVRLDSTAGRQGAFRHTMANTGDETTMRAALAAAVGGVVAGLNGNADLSLTEAEVNRLFPAADLVTLARTGVEYDYRGDVVDAHAPEMPTRFARQLQQIVRGGLALGIDRAKALRLAIRAARDSMPPVRLAIIDDLARHPYSTPSGIRQRVDLPRRTIDRQCQSLNMLGVLTADEVEYGDTGKSRWYYTLREGIDPNALQSWPDFAPPPPSPSLEEGNRGARTATSGVGVAKSGQVPPQVSGVPLCSTCREPLGQHAGAGCLEPVIHTPDDPWSSA